MGQSAIASTRGLAQATLSTPAPRPTSASVCSWARLLRCRACRCSGDAVVMAMQMQALTDRAGPRYWSTFPSQYDAEADEDDVRTEVTTGDGKTHKHTLPPASTVLVLKQHLAHDAGFKPGQTCMFVNDDSREEELEEGETLGSLRRGKGLAVLIALMVHMPNAQEVIAGLAAEADLVLKGMAMASCLLLLLA